MEIKGLVLKVASRCNLNCTYCYMYNMGDVSYKQQPKFMSEEIIRAIFIKIRNHCQENNLKKFVIIYHGGEPLLTGIEFYQNIKKIEKEILNNTIEILYLMQSNGVLLTQKYTEELKKIDVFVGISLDGTEISNNLNRIYHSGKGSYNEIIRGAKLIKDTYGIVNCICVIDVNQDPTEVYNHFKNIGVYSILFLFPDLNYLHTNINDAPKIGTWLIEVFKSWLKDEDDDKPIIRPYMDLLSAILGNEYNSEQFGKGKNDVLVVETNGSLEVVDVLKICGNGFTKNNFNILENELSDIFESSLANRYYNGHDDLCETCNNCPIENICGGGNIAHRYSEENGFNNPTIYCKEIVKMVCFLQNKVLNEFDDEFISKSKIEPLVYDDIIKHIQNYTNEV